MGKKKPAIVVIELFGGVRPLARKLDLTPGAVSKWKASGLVPSVHQDRLLELARELRLRLTADMLVSGV